MARLCFTALVLLLSSLPVLGQKDAAPQILQIYRDPVRPGKLPEYARVEAEAAQACYRANTWPYFTIQAVTGPQEIWFVSGFDTYDAMQRSAEPFVRNANLAAELNRLMEAKATLVSDPATIFLRYREDLGRNTGLVRPGTRYFRATWTSVAPGHEGEFEDSQRLIRSARERAGAADNRAVYQVTSGISGNLYLTFSPYHTFQEAAESLDGLLDYDDLDETVRGKLHELFAASVASSQTLIFSISPAMSNPAGEWIVDDPEFWKTSPPLQKQPPARKP